MGNDGEREVDNLGILPSRADMTPDELMDSAVARSGHFLLESGHHDDLWPDLALLCL